MASNNVTKIEIQGFRDKTLRTTKVGSFVVPINPDQLSQKFEVKSDDKQGSGNQGTKTNFGVTMPEELKLDFYLDNTNTITGNVHQGTPVPDQVKNLLRTVYYMDGQAHRPLYLKIGFGKNDIFGDNKPTFDCTLKSLDISYVLFKPDGEPLRAKVSAVFKAHVEDQKRVREEDKNSPDLTHVRTAVPGDQLWLMAHRIYGSPDYLLQVAQANNRNTLRRLTPSEKLTFPPFSRTEDTNSNETTS